MIEDDDIDALDTEEVDETSEASEPKKGKSSKAWLDAIVQAEKAFDDYQSKADNIDKAYANLEKLANDSRDRQFQLFWANIQVIGPSIYSRPPVPVVVPRFKERRPLPRTASELLERCTTVAFEKGGIDATMIQIRDDLTILARGAAWLRYEAKGENGSLLEKVCIEHVDRKDFLHDPARKWEEVDWTSKRSWMDRKAMRKRFFKTSGDAYKTASFSVLKEDKDNSASNNKLKAGVWEIWCKSENRVYWVTEGVDVCLDEDKPHLTLEGFFPCPKPAYSTVQRRSLVPVPDMTFYKDQLEEINELTARISALAGAVRVRGFYPAGSGEIGDAIEAALKATSDNQIMVPISNWAAFGNSGAKDMIVWLPIDMIVTTIKELVALRKELIDDVYQITGISDIMRGSTEASETLGAQQLKSQYGSVRIRDRQGELVRVALDITRIAAEIMAENFQPQTLLDMSQMELPTDADIKKQIDALKAQAQQITAAAHQKIAEAQANPQLMQAAQANPEQAQQVVQQLQQQAQQQLQQMQGQAQKLSQTITIDQVVKLLRSEKLRPFILDIETDSTISPDENAQKQRATEFITAVGGFLNQAIQAVETLPQIAPLMADTLKYVASQFRAGRELDTSIDEFADQMKQMAGQPKPPDPAHAKVQQDMQMAQQEAQAKQQERQLAQQTAQADQQRKSEEATAAQQREDAKLQADLQAKQADDQRKALESDIRIAQMHAEDQRKLQEHGQKLDIGALQIEKLRLEIEGVHVKTEAVVATTTAKIDQSNTQTDNAVRATDASVQATSDKTAIAADIAKNKAKEPA
jgi:hypothetical protein